MDFHKQWIAFKTIVYKEVKRVFRIWAQTLLPPVITTLLYFLIFGKVIGQRVGNIGGHSYITFIAPGLIMLSVITSSYSATVASFFSAKFQHSIEELLVSPLSSILILLGYVTGGVVRGNIVGLLVAIVAIFFAHLTVHSWLTIISVSLLSSMIFALGGIINAIYALKFDDIAVIPTFVLTPLTYLGGIFYSVSMLPKFWHDISLVNPILYIVNMFRYGFLGTFPKHLVIAYAVMLITLVILFFLALHLLNKGKNLRH